MSGFTTTAIPSIARIVSLSPPAFSSSVRLLLESPMSQRPSETAVMPEPEPVGLYVNVTPSFASIKDSPKAPITFSIDVEPSVETVPPALLFPQPVKIAAASAITSAMLKIFFIINSPFSYFVFFSFHLTVIMINI